MAPPARQRLGLAKDSDRIEERTAPSNAVRWSFVLTGFMRVLALLWILKGLSAWATILGIWVPAGAFETRSTGYQATVIYFAVIDLVAAIGLWMASTWGGVMWLLAVMSHLTLAAFFPRIVSGGAITVTFFLSFVATYLVLSWLSAQDN